MNGKVIGWTLVLAGLTSVCLGGSSVSLRRHLALAKVIVKRQPRPG